MAGKKDSGAEETCEVRETFLNLRQKIEKDRKQRRARKQKADSKQEEKDGITAGGGIIKAGSK